GKPMTRNPVLHFVSYGLQYVLIKECRNTLPELLGRLIHASIALNNAHRNKVSVLEWGILKRKEYII
ncbi:MAG: hypothetical protein KAT04_00810, partial [Methylococcales bacterium]|nr:hypothetical protein [Methylococcales bacterium]